MGEASSTEENFGLKPENFAQTIQNGPAIAKITTQIPSEDETITAAGKEGVAFTVRLPETTDSETFASKNPGFLRRVFAKLKIIH